MQSPDPSHRASHGAGARPAWPLLRGRRTRDKIAGLFSTAASKMTHVSVAPSSSTPATRLPRQIGIAGVQMHVAAGEDNIPAMARLVAQTRQRFPWVSVMVFPELAVFGSSPARAQPLPGEAESRLSEIARHNGVWLVPGSLFEQADGAVFNTAPVIAPNGAVVARYRKMFPFRPYEHGVEAGIDFVVFDIPAVARIGVSICYDMWFAETTRTLAAMGADVILHPTLTDTIDRDVELSIARASAATNQIYFFDINSIGDGGGIGRSVVVDPSGYVLHEGGHGQEIIPILVDLDRVHNERERGLRGLGQPLKSFRDRRVDFTVYDRSRFTAGYLESLGPLAKPRAGFTSGSVSGDHREGAHVVRGDAGAYAQTEES
jgi:predicted amidohydrolase